MEKKKKFSPFAWVLILSSTFLAIFLVASGVMFLSSANLSSSSADAPAFLSKGVVGVIEVKGVILDSKKTVQRLEKFDENKNVKAIVLRLNSPGGAVAPSQEIYEAVKRIKKPLGVSMGSVAASGAFYIASGAKRVYANPGTITGSIGVIMEFVNLSKLYEWAKINRYALKTGKYKGSGAEYREMTEEEKAVLQGMIENVLGQFKKAVAEGRKLQAEEVDAVADGRVFSGEQAKAARLIDELGTFQDAVLEAGKLGEIKGEPKIVYPEGPRRRWFETLLDDRSSDEEGASSHAGLMGLLREFVSGSSASEDIGTLQGRITGLEPGIYWLWGGAR